MCVDPWRNLNSPPVCVFSINTLPPRHPYPAPAVGRLEDESQLVVRAALRLLYDTVAHNPFSPALETGRFSATLAHLEAQLGAMGPGPGEESDEERDGEGRGGGEAGAEGGDGDGGARWEEGDVEMEDEDKEAATPRRGAAAADEASAQGGDAPADSSLDSPNRGTLPADSRRAELRHLVATLKEAIAFCRRLEGAMPALRALLACPHGDVVKDVIALLTFCRRFEVPGAAATLRGMWPLVFAREEGVRTAVLDAWYELYLKDLEPKAQAQLLLDEVMPSCTLGELAALEAILRALAAPPAPRLNAARLLRPLLTIPSAEYRRITGGGGGGGGGGAGDAAGGQGRDQADEEDGGGVGAAAEAAAAAGERRASRLTFQLISLLAAAAPEDVDPFIQRHTCLILSRAAPAILAPSALREFAAASPDAPGGAAARDEFLRRTFESLARLLVSPSGPNLTLAGAAGGPAGAAGSGGGGGAGLVTQEGNWPAAAEAALGALYALHPRPGALAGAVLARLAAAAGVTLAGGAPGAAAPMGGRPSSPAALARLFTVLGHAALHQLALSERLLRATRAGRAAADRDAAQAASDAAHYSGGGSGAAAPGKKRGKGGAKGGGEGAGKAGDEEEDIAAQLGVGATADELEAMGHEVEGQVGWQGL
ncbi:hypothetical protein MNEG_12341 [Monoraphidium neglectum]|uniref:Uncharacterized protein n=1 Tax=Monoraphidium neglectum TaxID=145388 RepID=A0A0D2ML95_9CHLO|nr:hypothetical protein MNEG_12341 [Monoraphidium neglectum]KIY95620.1 hypothetical protein MNEG_12341 [Monoraphidium neglectum]|eukprot:XP_013894640.1 hypothetical protein MNEG_12341 [Monoraphidium neglectum]